MHTSDVLSGCLLTGAQQGTARHSKAQKSIRGASKAASKLTARTPSAAVQCWLVLPAWPVMLPAYTCLHNQHGLQPLHRHSAAPRLFVRWSKAVRRSCHRQRAHCCLRGCLLPALPPTYACKNEDKSQAERRAAKALAFCCKPLGPSYLLRVSTIPCSNTSFGTDEAAKGECCPAVGPELGCRTHCGAASTRMSEKNGSAVDTTEGKGKGMCEGAVGSVLQHSSCHVTSSRHPCALPLHHSCHSVLELDSNYSTAACQSQQREAYTGARHQARKIGGETVGVRRHYVTATRDAKATA